MRYIAAVTNIGGRKEIDRLDLKGSGTGVVGWVDYRPRIDWANGGLWGWLGGAKMLCILRHRGVQLILAYSRARSAILVAGKGTGGMFIFLLFLHFHSCSSFFPVPLFHLFYYLFYVFSPFLWETTQIDPTRVNVRALEILKSESVQPMKMTSSMSVYITCHEN